MAIGIVNPNAGGIDIGAYEVYVCVPEGRANPDVRTFGTYTPDLGAMADWLVECGVTTVAMEATGVYWIPVYEVLESRHIDAQVVNARHTKIVPGRKSDVKDCQWLRDLHTMGLLRGSFRPPQDIAMLRSYLRHRANLISGQAVQTQHMQKALTLMNVRLTEVLSDITGISGMGIIRAIVSGERDARKLLKYRDRKCQHSPDDFVKALTGNYRAEHLFVLQQALALHDAFATQLAECDTQIQALFSNLPPASGDDLPPLPPSRKSNTHSKHAPAPHTREELYRITGVDLTDIDGLNESTVQTLVSETGTDMTRWPTVKHFCSWAGLAPHNDITGGRIVRSRTMKVRSPVNQVFRLAAQSAGRGKSAYAAFFRRLRARVGPAQAIVALAHKIARAYYIMLRHRIPFIAVSAQEYDQQHAQRERRSLERRASALGLRLQPA